VLGVLRQTPLAALALAASLILVSPAAARPARADRPEVAAGAAKRPGLFAGEYPAKFRARPAVVGGWTNDGSGFLGGADGNPPASFGHVKWTRWSSKTARGRGVVWATTDRSTWHSERPTTIVAWRPRKGHFTRLSFSYDAGSGYRKHTFKLRELNPAWL
jgi:hypothetical protein